MAGSTELLDLVLSRRSVSALSEPGPTHEQLERMLNAAGTVPDHGQLRPYRFAVIEGEGRAAFGDALASVAAERKPGMSDAAREGVRAKAFRSPTLIAVIASPKPGKIEVWEQHVTASAAGYAIVLAAHALGVGAVWKSVPFTRGRALTDLLGLAETEEMLGFIHLGTPPASEPAQPRDAVDVVSLTTLLDGRGARPFR
jgi:nitroreductase